MYWYYCCHPTACTQLEEINEDTLTDLKEEGKERNPGRNDTGEKKSLKECSKIFHDIRSTKEKMLNTDPDTEKNMTICQDTEKTLTPCGR